MKTKGTIKGAISLILLFAAASCSSSSPAGGPPDSGADGGASDGGSADGGALGDAGLCPNHQRPCGSACVTPQVDPANCGACGNACTGLDACSSGVCASACQDPLVACSNRCVDTKSDNAHCGNCGTSCDGGTGCVNGLCKPAVSLGAPPAGCTSGGPPIIVPRGDAGTCAGSVAQSTFRFALCSCSSIVISAPLVTDGYDSTQGPYGDAGVGGGGGVGTNGEFTGSQVASIGGALWVAGSDGLSSSSQLIVDQDLHVGGPWTMSSAQVAGDAFVAGDIEAHGASSVAGTLHLAPDAGLSGPFDAGAIVREAVSVSPACDCSPDELVPVADIVAARAASNDNASVSLDPAVFASPGGPMRLDLSCGNYYFTEIQASAPITIVAHGNTALYIAGDVVVSNALTVTLDATAELDVFIAGSLCSSGSLRLGSPSYPAQMRVYVAGDHACGTAGRSIRFSGPNNFIAANIFAKNGYESSAAAVNYGSIFAGAFQSSASTTIHYDRAVLSEGNTCSVPDGGPPPCSTCRDCGNQACLGDGHCGACTSSQECCPPLICNGGSCEPAACARGGEPCSISDPCCTGLICVTPSGDRCRSELGGCTCES